MRTPKFINKKNIFIFYIIAIFLIRLFLSTGTSVWAWSYNQYDDGMMIKDATSLLTNNWLGAFNQYTLAKGITFPLYLALINKIGISFIFANVFMCFLASLTFIMVMRKVIPSKISLGIIYTVLMFNPLASASWTFQRVYRDSLYSYLVIILFSLIIAIYLNRNAPVFKLFLYSIGAGLFLSATWLAREDSPWVLPFVAVALIITVYFILFFKQYKQKIIRILAITIVPLFLIISILVVSTINYEHYGVFATNEFTGGYLPKLFKVLSSIEPDQWMPDVPIPKSTREKAYKVSPTFAKLEPILEKHPFVVNENGNASCSMLAWAVIDSVQWSGRIDGESSQAFYKQSYEEISAAISEGKFKTRGGFVSMFESPLDIRYLKPLANSFGQTLGMTIGMRNFENGTISTWNMPSFGSNSQVKQLENLTHSKAFVKNEKIPSRQNKLYITNDISKLYYNLNPLFFILGTLCYIYISLRFFFSIRKKKYIMRDQWIILTGLFLSYLLRLLLISYTDVCSIFMKYTMYLAPSYWLMLMAIFPSIFIAIRDINIRRSKKHNKINIK